MNTLRRTAIAAILCTVALALAAPGWAELSEPDHIIYGTPTWYGDAMTTGVVSLQLDGATSAIASYTLGSDPTLGGLFVLRVPLDTVGIRRPGTARTGDHATVLLNGEPSGEVVIGERGVAQMLAADPDLASALPALSIGDAAIAEGDTGSRLMTLTITLSRAVEESVGVDWITGDGTAVGAAGTVCSGADFLEANGHVVIPAGDTAYDVHVPICGDVMPEADEVLYVDLLSPVGATLLDPQGRGTILDDDTPPQLSVNNVTVTEPPSGSVMANFRVSMSHTWDQPVTFHYQSAPGTAQAGLDYLSISGDGTVPVGSLETTVSVEVLADTIDEDDETFFLNLSTPGNATILDGQGQGTIVDSAQLLVFVEAEKDGIAGVSGLAGAFATAVSPDGDHVYAVGRSDDGLVVFDRDSVSGALTFKTSYSPGDFQTLSSAAFVGLNGPEAVAVSADGHFVYVAAFEDDAVAVFARDTDDSVPATYGTLTLVEVERNGVNDLSDPGPAVAGLDGPDGLALSSDDEELYVSAANSSSVAVFSRNAGTGRLSFVEAEVNGVDDPSDFGGTVDGLFHASAVAVSPDGTSVYITGADDHAVAVFDRSLDVAGGTKGRLSFLELQQNGAAGVSGMLGPTGLALSPDSKHVYVAGSTSSALVVFDRAANGRLTWSETVVNGSGSVQQLASISDVAVSHDGAYVYASALGSSALTVFRRDKEDASPTFGQLTFVEVKRDGFGGVDGLFGALNLALSSDDLSVYATGYQESGIAAFARDLTPPANPTDVHSASHIVGAFVNNSVITMQWSGADDGPGGSGVAGYSFVFDASPSTTPDATIDLEHHVDPHGTASSVLPDGDHYYFHLRTCDFARNCSAAVHLGPYKIDTIMPSGPGSVASTSHVEGVPNTDPVIVMQWSPATDPGPVASGLAGYSYVFSDSGAPACNQEVDLAPGVTTVSSTSLADGIYYFHICVGDAAGNWAPSVTTGPYYVGDDTVPPRLEILSSVAAPPGGAFNGPHVVHPGGASQLLLGFNEPMYDPAGDSDAADVTNPANYLVVDAGPNATLETTDCTTPGGDDVAVGVAGVLYDEPTSVAALVISDAFGMMRGPFRVLACPSLLDRNGNALDGNGDLTGGDTAIRDLRIGRTNLLLSPNLDADLADWSLSNAAAITSDAEDAGGAATSGSAFIHRATGGDRDLALSQCVNVSGITGVPYRIQGKVRIAEALGGDPGAPEAFGSVIFYSGAACTGGQLGAETRTNTVTDDTAGAWIEMSGDIASPPAGALSALVSFDVNIPPSEDFVFDTWFDDLLFATSDLTPPTDPSVSSTSHTEGAWSHNPVIDMQFSGAVDDPNGVGVAGYSFLFDGSPATEPDTVLDLDHTGGVQGTSSAPLADGTYYFHLRTCDWLGNCSGTVHKGPFKIDTQDPGAATDVISTTHTIGVPTEANVITMSWTPAVDPGPVTSGIAGYAYAFDTSSLPACSQVANLGSAASAVASPPIPNASYYFHLCAVDEAGNWGSTTTTGPFIIDDQTPPTVVAVRAIANTPDGVLDSGEATDVPITQVVLSFSEYLQDPPGSSSTVDASNPASYSLLGAGPDGVFESVSCGIVLGDDFAIPIASATYSAAPHTVLLRLAGQVSIPAGQFQLEGCATGLADITGNPIDGNADGTGGDSFARPFVVTLDNLLLNSNLDGTMSPWTGLADPPGGASFTYSATDHDGEPTSGSAFVHNTNGPDAAFSLSQCVDISAQAGPFHLFGHVNLAKVDGDDPDAYGQVHFYDGAGCSGTEVGSISTNVVSGSTGGTWNDLFTSSLMKPTGAISALIAFGATVGSTPNGDFTVGFDSMTFGPGVAVAIFADGFEAGNLNDWSNHVP